MLSNHASVPTIARKGWILAICLIPSLLGTSFVSHGDVTDAVSPQTAVLQGAWVLTEKGGENPNDLGINMIKILSENHFMFAFYHEATQSFFSAGGGTYTLQDGRYTETILFHTIDPGLIGRQVSFDCRLEGDKWYHTGNINGGELNEVFSKADEVDQALLAGSWHLSAFEDPSGKMVPIRKSGPMRLKVISGSHFQYAYFDVAKKMLIESWGGTYSFDGTEYQEKIVYHSKHPQSVGHTTRLFHSDSIQN